MKTYLHENEKSLNWHMFFLISFLFTAFDYLQNKKLHDFFYEKKYLKQFLSLLFHI